ncbi:GLPGLI family protein [Sphingobacterium sp.]|uniref:GLPGLI family protein n=1 Tax=Sphingobacterium sp. TaxID=341027 RepID=UPI002583EEFE|nr:GLPGLI family protein [Sphingobacterium sp.]WET67008.1 MAG: GLPGLI family protein [Sphingobacterium sp.]
MKNYTLILIILSLIISPSFAQYVRFVRSGVIEYQKRINMHAIIGRSIDSEHAPLMSSAYQAYKREYPQFKELKSSLVFKNNKTVFTPVGENTSITRYFDDPHIVAQNNIVYSDMDTGKLASKRIVFDQTYLVKDSLRAIKWKFTDEVRDIAGYPCRRANGLVIDSVYVVAFYTDKIPISGGPELFGGLPGMILQVVLPHENVSWTATKVEDLELPENSIVPPTSGTIIDFNGLTNKLKSIHKDGTKNAFSDLLGFLL